MDQPNIVPNTPRFHRIDKQTSKLVGGYFMIQLEIFCQEPDRVDKVEFMLPVEYCTEMLTVIPVGLHVDHGWTLFLPRNRYVIHTSVKRERLKTV